MTGFDLLEFGAIGTVAAGLGAGAATWRAQRQAAAERRQAQDQATRLRSESERLRAAASASNQRVTALERTNADLMEARTRLEASVESVRQELAQSWQSLKTEVQRLEADVQSARAREGDARRTVGERELRISQLEAESQRLQGELRLVRDRLAAVTKEKEGAANRGDALAKDLNLTRQALAAFGVKTLTTADPLAASKRPETRAALVALWSDQDADGVALVDGRGLALAGVGSDAAVDQLATIAAHVAQAESALHDALGGAVREFSTVRGEAGQHLMRLGDSGIFLGLGGRGRPPALAMRLTAMSLVGVSAEERKRPVRIASPQPEQSSRKAHEIQAILVDWAGRWLAEGAALVNADGKVLAATSVDVGRRLGEVRAALRPLYLRAVRDELSLRQLEITASSLAGDSLALRAIGNRPNSLSVVVSSPTQVPREAVDELVDSLRWLAVQGGDGAAFTAEAA